MNNIKYFDKIRLAINSGQLKILDNRFCKCMCGTIIRPNSYYMHIKSNIHKTRLINKKADSIVFLNKNKIVNLHEVKKKYPNWYIKDARSYKNLVNVEIEKKKLKEFWLNEKKRIDENIKRDKYGNAIVSMD